MRPQDRRCALPSPPGLDQTEAFIFEQKIGNLLAGPWSSWL